MTTAFAPGSLVSARGRDWVVLPETEPDMLVLRPLGGSDDDVAALFPALEDVQGAHFAPPTADDLGSAKSSLFNALCGLEFSRVGITRPT
ncbi:hypothetical protein ACFQZ2_12585, partial [Streptomonospora algeriensis]